MSKKGRAGKAEWEAKVPTYRQELAEGIQRDAAARMAAWTAAGRIPLRVRIMSRLRGQPVHLPEDEGK
ncbi:hypothetical protein [Nocardioides sp.]|uniref:hypothetical protein n=1 Tax=Nocardioides sp. TaxID=35761 RepID=UPI0039E4BDE7